MRYGYSAQLREDLNGQVVAALHSRGIINVAAVAEEVRRRNLSENIALEDIECLVVQVSQLYGAPMEFDGLTAILPQSDVLDEASERLPGEGAPDIDRSALPDRRQAQMR
ncbi:hypothetical protein [Mesorhizobium waimense]|uniref:hypothetical protein n=1 Tax=Mesorhizobium waimense TaxID=1300307 RepID=UPI001FE14F49|nr:hypothetical protein [Mesorhizobium waimense]